MTLTKIDRAAMVFFGLGLGWLGFGGAFVFYKIGIKEVVGIGPIFISIILYFVVEICCLMAGSLGVYTIIKAFKGDGKSG